eukprot:TRINITY_DN14647_c0_g1_i2.p1 TRINITY_DN14647_c0_g1~~TRINITY_DN14647_c0_g1_i2.p1  ORF type:complete len:643 (+),score=48.44 TRINITY_DN14647_c0_g1_i2:80-2008(+)
MSACAPAACPGGTCRATGGAPAAGGGSVTQSSAASTPPGKRRCVRVLAAAPDSLPPPRDLPPDPREPQAGLALHAEDEEESCFDPTLRPCSLRELLERPSDSSAGPACGDRYGEIRYQYGSRYMASADVFTPEGLARADAVRPWGAPPSDGSRSASPAASPRSSSSAEESILDGAFDELLGVGLTLQPRSQMRMLQVPRDRTSDPAASRTARASVGAAAAPLSGGGLLVSGGRYFSGADDDAGSARMHVYYPGSSRWVEARPLQRPPPPRHSHAACAAGDVVYIFGGRHRGELRRDLWRLTSCTDADERCTQLWVRAETVYCSMAQPRWGHTMVSVERDGCTELLVFGGVDDGGVCSAQLSVFASATARWRHYSAPAPGEVPSELLPQWPQPRCGHAAASRGDTMWIHGGCRVSNMDMASGDDEHNLLDDLWELQAPDPAAAAVWRQIVVLGAVPRARRGHSMHWGGGELHLAGGTLADASHRSPRSAVRARPFWGTDVVRRRMEMFSIDPYHQQEWTRAQWALAVPAHRSGHSACVSQETLWLFGGDPDAASCAGPVGVSLRPLTLRDCCALWIHRGGLQYRRSRAVLEPGAAAGGGSDSSEDGPVRRRRPHRRYPRPAAAAAAAAAAGPAAAVLRPCVCG